MSETIDFEAEGLLDGLEGEERESRLALLERLADDGATLEELRDAVADGRLALLPLERMLAGPPALHAAADLRAAPASRSTSSSASGARSALAVPGATRSS